MFAGKTRRFAVLLLAGLLGATVARSRGDDANVVSAESARDHADKTATVEFTVESSRKLSDREVAFLNSRKNHRDSNNFTAVIFRDGLESFKSANIDDPANHFKGKKVRVSGKIVLRDERPQIIVKTSDQVKIVEDKTESK